MRLVPIIAATLVSIAAQAQNDIANDTITSSKELQEIVVEAPKVIRKSDMDLFIPSKSAVKNSKDGLQLLKNMMIPTLTVNDVLGSITSSGESVQIRINGRQATIQQVTSLLPETIKRVEWIDDPGLRYNNANAVLNFIVSNPSAGGSLMTNALQSLNCPFGNYNASLKLNNGRSQWSAFGNYKLLNRCEGYRDYYEQFTYPDGEQIIRTEKPIGGHLTQNTLYGRLDYSYIKPDTTVFYVSFDTYKTFRSESACLGLMSLSNGQKDINLLELKGNKGIEPSMTAYLEQHFANKQILAIDLRGSIYSGNSYSTYQERLPEASDYITDVNTLIKDRNQSYSIEANYIKKWKRSRFTAGMSYNAKRNRSLYENLDGKIFHQSQDKLYFFGEYYQKIKKVSLTVGLGGQYTSLDFKETGKGNSKFFLKPSFAATYRLSDTSMFRLNFSAWQSAPSLTESNEVPQQIDGFQWRVGNPDLKNSTSYKLRLRYNFTFPKVLGTFGIIAFTSPDAIAPYLYWDNDKLITSYENSRGFQNLTLYLSPQIEVIRNWLSVSGTIRYRAERMKGTGYTHYNHNWSGEIEAQLQHWGFMLNIQYQKASKNLFGEKISYGESVSVVSLDYGWKKFRFSLGVLCPFTKYDQGSMSLNKYNKNESHTRTDIMPMPFVRINYNIQWGRQKRSANKLVNAENGIEKSSAGGR